MKSVTLFCVGVVASLILALSSPLASAASVAADSFETYTTGPVAGGNDGTGWGGAWGAPGNANTFANVIDASADSLSFTPSGGLLVDGGNQALHVGVTASPPGNVPATSRALATPLTGTFYVGYLVRYENTGAGGWDGNNTFSLHLSTNASATASLNFGLRSSPNASDPSFANQFMVRSGTGNPATGATTGGMLTPDTDYYLVAMLNYSPQNTFDSIQLWVNPTATDNVDTPNGDAQFAFTSPGSGLGQISHVFFRQAVLQTDDVLLADRLVIGTAWGDVVPVPEPAVWTLALLGGMAALCLVRRRNQ